MDVLSTLSACCRRGWVTKQSAAEFIFEACKETSVQPRERRKFEPVYRWSGRQVRLWVLVWLRSLYSLTLFRQAKNMLSETRGSITIFVIDCAYLRAHGDCRSVQSGDAAEHDGKTYYFRGNAF